MNSGPHLPVELQFRVLDRIQIRRNHSRVLKTVALVCHHWRDWAWAILFRNLTISSDIHALRGLTDLCRSSAEHTGAVLLNAPTKRTYRNLGSFIRYIVITLGQPTGYGMIEISDLFSLLAYTSDLEDLALFVIEPSSIVCGLEHLRQSTFMIPSLSSLRIRSYANVSGAVCQFIGYCPSLKHLSLELSDHEFREYELTGISPPPKLTSFRSLGCWAPNDKLLNYFVFQASNTSFRSLELHRSPSPTFLSQLAERHGENIESLTLRSMELAATRIWEHIIGQFTGLRHLSVWCLPSSALLASICVSDLRHFEFRRPWTHGHKDIPQLEGIARFLKDCPSLRAVTYHSTVPIEIIDQAISSRGLVRTWKENHFVDGYMEDVSANRIIYIYCVNLGEASRYPRALIFIMGIISIPGRFPRDDQAPGTKC